MNLVILIGLIAVGIYDMYLYLKGKKTISQKLEELLPEYLDLVVVIVALVLAWWLFGGIETFNKVLIGVLLGHCLLGHERYKR